VSIRIVLIRVVVHTRTRSFTILSAKHDSTIPNLIAYITIKVCMGAAKSLSTVRDHRSGPRYDHGPRSHQKPVFVDMWVRAVVGSNGSLPSDTGRVATPLSAGPTRGFGVGLVDLWLWACRLVVPTSPERQSLLCTYGSKQGTSTPSNDTWWAPAVGRSRGRRWTERAGRGRAGPGRACARVAVASSWRRRPAGGLAAEVCDLVNAAAARELRGNSGKSRSCRLAGVCNWEFGIGHTLRTTNLVVRLMLMLYLFPRTNG